MSQQEENRSDNASGATLGVSCSALLGYSLIRIPLWKRWELAKRTGMDRAHGHGRSSVGPFVQTMFHREGWRAPVALLPMFGEKWPDSVSDRCDQIEAEYGRILHKPNAERSHAAPGVG